MGKKSSKKKSKDKAKKKASATPFTDALRVGEGFLLSDVDTRSTPAFTGDKAAGEEALAAADAEMDDLQERLYAHGRSGGTEKVLLVIQGLDTSGKGGIMRHVVGAVDPQGTQITAFKAPTKEELAHPFLWRIRKALPEAGMIGVFDRSHYEDVLIVRVHNLVEPAVWGRRYSTINDFEQGLVEDDTTVIKVMLHFSKEEQGERLAERLENPEKFWKYNPGDVDERMHWDDYMEAYQAVLDKTSTQAAPWFVVPADRKWYARLAVQQLLREHLRALDLQWPEADFDVEAEKKRLAETR
ncbi:polyphosphate kinase 2 family protein [Ornithinimicrobium sp. F0845]|uniref:PPK2 family polyphosphate kinase n=1 Tax=Ornithinimicrobium sp. F0845 TaxID=2926412 RepID=UPI001FF50AAA|nr:PPK2 family polyphosphate kinase [Ornithinimicrobium sp. F0845]MCK0111876.1 polyphosphate kinase 2 family protein [Ornithinimicrobium sp. F0845]